MKTIRNVCKQSSQYLWIHMKVFTHTCDMETQRTNNDQKDFDRKTFSLDYKFPLVPSLFRVF